MWEYLEWWNGYKYLRLSSWPLTALYFLFAGVVYIVRMYVYVVFFWSKCFKEEKETESLHGPLVRKHIMHSIPMALLAITIGPLIEEAIFRGPVLWFVEKSQYGYALVALIISSVIFALAHLGSYGKYQDGSDLKKTKSSIYNTIVGGIFYGTLVIVTGSLWPAIFLHVIWNISAITIGTFYEERFNVFALSLQR